MALNTADERFKPVKRGVATLDIWVMGALAAITIWVLFFTSGATSGQHLFRNPAVGHTPASGLLVTDSSAQQHTTPSVKPITRTEHGAATQPAQPAQKLPATAETRMVLYKGAFMRPFRLLVRFKIFQLVGIASLAIPINTFLVQGSVEGVQMVIATSLVIGCAAASSALWYYSRRYVGELSLLPETHQACFSVLDFWGNREDTYVDIRRILPPLKDVSQAARKEMAELPLIPIDVEADRQYLISLRHGIFVDRVKLFQLLEGQQIGPVDVSS